MKTHLTHFIRINLVLWVVLSELLSVPVTHAATITVTNTNDNGTGSLRQAILDAGDGDTITFDSALTASGPATIALSTADADIRYGLSAFTISTTLTIQGPTGPNGITLARAAGTANLRLFYVTGAGSLTLQNLTLSNGLAQGQAAGSGYQRSGGGGGGAGLGGAIFNQGQLTLTNSTLTGNQAVGGASRTTNYSGGGGGGGGGLAGPGASGTPYTAGGDGGAPLGGAGSASKEAAQPNGEAGGVGGGGGGGGAGDHQLDPNFSTKPGGAGGAGGFGAGGGGGGAYDSWGSGGNAGGAGGAGGFGGGGGGGGGGTPGGAGGIGGFGAGTGEAGADNGNVGGYGGGGAGLGGAIFNDGGAVTITNSTLSDNSAVGWHDQYYPDTDSDGYGAGIFSRNGTVTIVYSTLAQNSADYGGGLYLLGDGAAASATLNGTIVAGAEGSHDIQVSAINGGSQTTGGADNMFLNDADFSGSYVKADPLLGPLQNNGGPTWTRALDLNSPALDAVAVGDNGCGTTVTADQRGVGRPAGSACDLGAFESTAFNLRIVKTVSGQLFMPGQPITYTLAFSNTAGLPATGVIITDHVPGEVINLSYSSSGVTITNTGASPDYAWQVDDLAPRAGGLITITGSIDPGLAVSGRLTNTASIAPLDDFTPGDNTSSAAVQVCTQTVYTVTDDGDSGPGTLRQTIIDACPGATVDFDLTYPAVITLTTGAITIDKDLTILGPGVDKVRVDGNGASGVLSMATDLSVAISDLTISGGYSADSGGGVFADAGTTLDLNGVKITGNAADYSGGGLYVSGSASLTDTDVVDNIAYGSWHDGDAGGGAYVGGDVTLVNGRFENNQAYDAVGGGLFTEGSLTLNGTQFISNSAALAGGGAQVLSTAWLTGGRFEGNQSNGGGGGGGLRTSDLVLTNTIFISNTAESASAGGGGVLVVYDGTASLDGGQFIGNTTSAEGGGLLALGDATLTGTEFLGNSAAGKGGGASVAGVGDVTGGLYRDNLSGGSGGGLYASDTLTVTGTQFLNNSAAYKGGGLHAEFDSRIVNALFASNTTGVGGTGAAMSLFNVEASGYRADVIHTTIVGPEGSTIPAIGIDTSSGNELVVTNTLLASYATGFDVTGADVTLDYDLFYNVAVDGFDIGAHSITGTNPLLADPTGGDYHLTSASPALDAGMFAGVTSDIDGDTRPTTSTCFDAPDIGADEFVGLTVQRPVADSMTFGATHARLIFNDPASVGFITMTVAPGLFPTNNPADQVVSRTITIEPDVPGAVVSATLSLCYEANELKSGLPEEQMQFYRWTGTNWQGYPSTVDVIHHAVTTTEVVGFSRWIIGIMSPTPTAIVLDDLRTAAGRSVGDAAWIAIVLGLAVLSLAGWAGRRRRT